MRKTARADTQTIDRAKGVTFPLVLALLCGGRTFHAE